MKRYRLRRLNTNQNDGTPFYAKGETPEEALHLSGMAPSDYVLQGRYESTDPGYGQVTALELDDGHGDLSINEVTYYYEEVPHVREDFGCCYNVSERCWDPATSGAEGSDTTGLAQCNQA